MDYKKHILVSVPPSVFVAYSIGVWESILFLIGAVLIDVDHIFDYILLNRKKFSVREFIRVCEKKELDRVLLLFHSFELLIAGIVFFRFSPFLFLFLGGIYHLIFDSIVNLSNPLGYFLLFRIYSGLKIEKFIKK